MNEMNDFYFEREIKYLSPSSISQAVNNPNIFYAQRLIEEGRIPREPQNLAMGVGTIFDIDVKEKIINLGVPCPIPMDKIRSALQNEDIREESQTASDQLMKIYRKSGLLARTKWHQIEGEFHQEYTFPTSKGQEYTVPLMGKLDAMVIDPETKMVCALDWKCSGYSSSNGASPKPLFMEKWDGKEWKGSHKKYYDDMPVTELPNDWARQFTIYAIMVNHLLGIKFLTPTPVWVHHPIFNGKHKKPMVAVYRAIATAEAQQYFWDESVRVWNSLKDGSFVETLKIIPDSPMKKSALISYANQCESFFRGSEKSAQELFIESLS